MRAPAPVLGGAPFVCNFVPLPLAHAQDSGYRAHGGRCLQNIRIAEGHAYLGWGACSIIRTKEKNMTKRGAGERGCGDPETLLLALVDEGEEESVYVGGGNAARQGSMGERR
ncbi:hypothetical protein B0H19DRAFT_1069219 [Mycena capillaripes]|nr:hypothetical protein B0H19DRAFT_1069219 [Mycena capillaripes]